MSAPTRGSVNMSEPAVLLRARDASRIVRPCRDCGRVTADLALVNLEGQRDAATAWWLPYCADAPAEPTAWLPRRAQWWRLPVLGDWNTTSHECGRGACWINHAGELVGP